MQVKRDETEKWSDIKYFKWYAQSFETYLVYDGKYWNFDSERSDQNCIPILGVQSWGYISKQVFGQ